MPVDRYLSNSRIMSRVTLSAVLIALLSAAGNAFAAGPSEMLATMSEAKARAEGRARLLRSCGTGGSTIPAAILTQYEDARASFNARVDALVIEMKSKKLKDFDISAEIPRFNVPLNRIDKFAVDSDALLAKQNCAVLRKASWAKIAALLVTPEMFKVVLDFFQSSTSSDTERDDYIKKFEAQRIQDWANVRLILAYDWKTSTFYTAEAITPQILTKGSTSVYVNEWGLTKAVGKEPALAKELPTGLSGSYKLYTGDLAIINRSVGGIN